MVEMSSSIRPHGWRTRLARWLGLNPVPADVAGELAALRLAVAGFAQAQSDAQATIGALRETIDRLERQIGRSGKEQFKANALADAQQQNVKVVLEQLRDAERYREHELADLRERLLTARRDGRMEVIERLLSVADGLDEAVASGERLLAKARAGVWENREAGAEEERSGGAPVTRRRSRLGRAWAALWRGPVSVAPAESTAAPTGVSSTAASDALTAWLEGLKFVRDRLFDILSAEGVYPVEAEGDTFDPHLHVAIETVPADGIVPGTIVRETRRGYLAGETVLRYAEVVVAR